MKILHRESILVKIRQIRRKSNKEEPKVITNILMKMSQTIQISFGKRNLRRIRGAPRVRKKVIVQTVILTDKKRRKINHPNEVKDIIKIAILTMMMILKVPKRRRKTIRNDLLKEKIIKTPPQTIQKIHCTKIKKDKIRVRKKSPNQTERSKVKKLECSMKL